MVDIPGGFNDDNRPKLKKIKRIIKRVEGARPSDIPSKSEFPTNEQRPFVDNRPSNEQHKPSGTEIEAYSLDNYLDSNENVADDDNLLVNPSYSYGENNLKSKFIVGNYFTRNSIIAAAVVALFIGIIFGKISSPGEKVVQDGLQGVVVNQEVPRGRARCGMVERTQGCVLYIMNPERQELNAKDFFDLAAQLTKRQKFVIDTGNMRYSTVKIKPGAIAQINIPPLTQ